MEHTSILKNELSQSLYKFLQSSSVLYDNLDKYCEALILKYSSLPNIDAVICSRINNIHNIRHKLSTVRQSMTKTDRDVDTVLFGVNSIIQNDEMLIKDLIRFFKPMDIIDYSMMQQKIIDLERAIANLTNINLSQNDTLCIIQENTNAI